MWLGDVAVHQGRMSGHQPGGCQQSGHHGCLLEPMPRRTGRLQSVQVLKLKFIAYVYFKLRNDNVFNLE